MRCTLSYEISPKSSPVSSFVDQRRLETVDRHFINIEEARIAFVGREEERLAIMAPAKEVGFDLLARREIAFGTVELAQVKVIVFVAATIVGVKKARVVWKISNGEGALFGRGGQLRGAPPVTGTE